MAARFHKFVESNFNSIVESKYFTLIMLIVVVSNTILMIFETYDDYYEEFRTFFTIAERIYLFVYVVEFCLKFWIYSWKFFAKLWNCFDLFIIVISVIDLISHELTHEKTSTSFQIENQFVRWNHFLRVLRVLRVLRSFRALRVLRTIRFIRPLHQIVKTCAKALPAMATISFIMIIITCIAAILARNLFGDVCPENFDNLVRTFFSLFVLLTLDDWFSIYQKCQERNYSNWQLVFCLIYIFVMNFILLNLLMAVLVDSFQHTLENDDSDESNDDDQIEKRVEENLMKLIDEFSQKKTSPDDRRKQFFDKYFRSMENLEFRIERHELLTKLTQKTLKILSAEQDVRKK